MNKKAWKDSKKYCQFYHDFGHNTKNCITLKRKIESLIWCGYLCSYVSQPNTSKAIGKEPQTIVETPMENKILIDTILGGLAAGGHAFLGTKPMLG